MRYDDINLYIVYFTLSVRNKIDYKSIIKAGSPENCKEILRKKIDRDFVLYELSNIRCFKINPYNYKGRRLSDKQIDILIDVSYPNTKHKLFKFKKDAWFKSVGKNRNNDGTFKKGFIPWNKNLKLKT